MFVCAGADREGVYCLGAREYEGEGILTVYVTIPDVRRLVSIVRTALRYLTDINGEFPITHRASAAPTVRL